MTDHRIKKIATVSGMMAADAFQWTDRNIANMMIEAANASTQKMYETGEADYVWPNVLDDSMTRQEFVDLGVNPMADDTYNYYGKDGVAGPGKVKNFTNEHIGDQPMQSLISIAEHYADKIAQPTVVIYSTGAVTAICSTNFIDKLANEHEVKAFDEFSHVDFYWKPEAVKASCDAVAEFFNK